jgi:alkylhydroperoxidase family enzyme
VDIGSAVGRAQGLTLEQLSALDEAAASPLFSTEERLVVALAEAMTAAPAEVPEPLWAALRAVFDEGQLVELAAAIAWENWRARFNHAFGLGAEGFSEEGVACLLPAAAS